MLTQLRQELDQGCIHLVGPLLLNPVAGILDHHGAAQSRHGLRQGVERLAAQGTWGSGSNRTKSSFQRDAPAQTADIFKLMEKTYL